MNEYNAKPWLHRYLLVRNGSIESGHGTIDEVHRFFLARRKAAGFRIDFGEVIDTWTEPGAQVPVTGDIDEAREGGRILWFRWDPSAGPATDESDPMGIGARFAAMELR